MFKAAIKSLLGRKLRLLMSTFAIVLGVAFVVGSLVFSDMLSRSFESIFASSVGDVVVRPDGGTIGQGSLGTASLPASLVTTLEGAEGAQRVDGQVQGAGIFLIGADGKLVGGNAPTFGLNANDAPSAGGGEGLTIQDGREPQGAAEVVIDEFSAERAGYQIGETVKLVTAGKQAQIEATLVGTAGYDQGGSLNGATILLFDTATARDLFLEGKDAYSEIWVSARPGVSQVELQRQVKALAGDKVSVKTGDQLIEEQGENLREAIGFITTFLLVFAFIALVVGSYLIVNTFSILLAQRSRELALFRALGASTRQVRWSVLAEAFVVGVFGALLGIVVGLGLAQLLKVLFGFIGLDLAGQSVTLEPRTLLAAFAVGVPVTMMAAYFPAQRTARIAPVQALGDAVALPESAMTRRLILGSVLLALGSLLAWLGLFGDIENYPLVYLGAGLLGVLLGATAWAPVIARPFLALMQRIYARVWGQVGNLAGQNGV
ncbi:MAG: ABC transporter permease, partial [Nocardioides sp.]